MTVSAYTPNFKLALIDFNSQNWHGDAWDNLMLIDAILKADFASAPYTNATGTNTIVLDYTPNITAYASGLTLLFKLQNAPTAATTINADSLGAKSLKIAGADIVSGDLIAGDVVRAIYDGTNFNVVEPVRVFAKLRVTVGSGSGGIAATTADDIIVNADVSGGISILTPNTAQGSINFGDSSANNAGSIVYNHNTDRFTYSALIGHSFVGSVTVTGALATTGAITQAGNQVWHAGNLVITNYAALAGTNIFTGLNTFRGNDEVIRLRGSAPYLQAYSDDLSAPYGFIQFNSTTTIVAGAAGGTATLIVGSTTNKVAVNAADGTVVTGPMTVSGAIKQGTDQVWHAGNFTPGNYALLAGPTFTGTVTLPSTTTVGGTSLLRLLSGTGGGRVKVQAQSGADYTGFVDNDFSFEY